MLRRELAREFRRHDFVLGRDGLTEREKERFLRLRDESASYEEYLDALRFLSDCLFRVCCRKTVILLDEYDVPLENAFFEGFYEEMLTIVRFGVVLSVDDRSADSNCDRAPGQA